MTFRPALAWLQATPPAVAITESIWLFPVIETLHVIGLALVVGSIVSFDLRILGIGWRARPTTTLVRDILPWTWTGFALALVTGALMFSSAAVRYAGNAAFLLKMGVLLVAGANVLFFHFHPHQSRLALDGHAVPVMRVSAALSLILWLAMVGLGRWIAFV